MAAFQDNIGRTISHPGEMSEVIKLLRSALSTTQMGPKTVLNDQKKQEQEKRDKDRNKKLEEIADLIGQFKNDFEKSLSDAKTYAQQVLNFQQEMLKSKTDKADKTAKPTAANAIATPSAAKMFRPEAGKNPILSLLRIAKKSLKIQSDTGKFIASLHHHATRKGSLQVHDFDANKILKEGAKEAAKPGDVGAPVTMGGKPVKPVPDATGGGGGGIGGGTAIDSVHDEKKLKGTGSKLTGLASAITGGFGLMDHLFADVVDKEIEFNRMITRTAFQVQGINKETIGLAKSWEDVGRTVAETGLGRSEFLKQYLKNAQRGFKTQDQMNKITKIGLNLSTMISSEVGDTSETMADWSQHLQLSTDEMYQLSRNVQDVSKFTGVTGDKLLGAVKSAEKFVTNMRNAGTLSAKAASNIIKLQAIGEQKGVGDQVGQITDAMSTSRKLFFEASSETRNLIMMASDRVGRLGDAQKGVLLKTREGMREFGTGVATVLEEQLAMYGQTIDTIDQLSNDELMALNLNMGQVFGMGVQEMKLISESYVEMGKSVGAQIKELTVASQNQNATIEERALAEKNLEKVRTSTGFELLNEFSKVTKGPQGAKSVDQAMKDMKLDPETMADLKAIGVDTTKSAQKIFASTAEITAAMLKKAGGKDFTGDITAAIKANDMGTIRQLLSDMNTEQQKLGITEIKALNPIDEAAQKTLEINEGIRLNTRNMLLGVLSMVGATGIIITQLLMISASLAFMARSKLYDMGGFQGLGQWLFKKTGLDKLGTMIYEAGGIRGLGAKFIDAGGFRGLGGKLLDMSGIRGFGVRFMEAGGFRGLGSKLLEMSGVRGLGTRFLEMGGFRGLGSRILDIGGFKGLFSKLSGLYKARGVGGVASGVASGIGGKATAIFEVLGASLGRLGGVAKFAGSGLKLLGGVLGKLALPLTVILGAIGALTGGFKAASNAAEIFGVAQEDVTFAQKAASFQAGAFTGVLNFLTFGIFGKYLGPGGTVTKWLSKLAYYLSPLTWQLGLLSKALAWLWDWIKVGWGLIKDFGSGFIEGFMEPVKAAWQSIKAAMQPIADVWNEIKAAFMPVLEALFPSVGKNQEAIASFGETMKSIGKAVGFAVGAMLIPIRGLAFVIKVLLWPIKILGKVLSGIGGFAGDVVEAFGGLSGIFKAVILPIDIIKKGISLLGSGLEWIGGIFVGAFNLWKKTAGYVIGTIGGIISGAFDLWKAGASAALNFILKPISWIKKGLEKLKHVTVSTLAFLQKPVQWIKDGFGSFLDAVINGFSILKKYATSAMSIILKPIEWIKNSFDSFKTALTKLYEYVMDVVEKITNIPKHAKEAAVNAADKAVDIAAHPAATAGANSVVPGLGTMIGIGAAIRKYFRDKEAEPTKTEKVPTIVPPKAATGGYVEDSGLAVIHKGEQITPEKMVSKNETPNKSQDMFGQILSRMATPYKEVPEDKSQILGKLTETLKQFTLPFFKIQDLFSTKKPQEETPNTSREVFEKLTEPLKQFNVPFPEIQNLFSKMSNPKEMSEKEQLQSKDMLAKLIEPMKQLGINNLKEIQQIFGVKEPVKAPAAPVVEKDKSQEVLAKLSEPLKQFNIPFPEIQNLFSKMSNPKEMSEKEQLQSRDMLAKLVEPMKQLGINSLKEIQQIFGVKKPVEAKVVPPKDSEKPVDAKVVLPKDSEKPVEAKVVPPKDSEKPVDAKVVLPKDSEKPVEAKAVPQPVPGVGKEQKVIKPTKNPIENAVKQTSKGLDRLAKTFKHTVQMALEPLEDTFEDLSDILVAATPGIKAFSEMIAKIAKIVLPPVKGAIAALIKITEPFSKAFESIQSVFIKFFNTLAKSSILKVLLKWSGIKLPDEVLPEAATGGMIKKSGKAIIHKDEQVLTPEMVTSIAKIAPMIPRVRDEDIFNFKPLTAANGEEKHIPAATPLSAATAKERDIPNLTPFGISPEIATPTVDTAKIQPKPLMDVHDRVQREHRSAEMGTNKVSNDDLTSIANTSESQLEYLMLMHQDLLSVISLLKPTSNLSGSTRQNTPSTRSNSKPIGSPDYGNWQFGKPQSNAGKQVINDGVT